MPIGCGLGWALFQLIIRACHHVRIGQAGIEGHVDIGYTIQCGSIPRKGSRIVIETAVYLAPYAEGAQLDTLTTSQIAHEVADCGNDGLLSR